ncbi:MAG TPA: Gfo/Idh/MocA family oxidoreductase [Parapedobacter sp.]|uniref:Gfo/Idh/MocA family protein n=1 Tax=Parapedobacter sp. TaxID=1958893 RepID=UPI002CDD7F19|nr:Gfo/Idh/MocA family oxidoreductase [Parapedobacter sp.]HWK59284.1 Gfo/Idh/MocA family oxidoreductase [Parapedobacter sp.]
MTVNTSRFGGGSSRRTFLKTAGTMAAILPLAHQFSVAGELFPAKKKILKIGLIGCGGRGTGAAAQALRADPDVELVAMGDIFEDQITVAYDALMKIEPSKIKVKDRHKYVGFDAYQKVIDAGVDVVLLATPPVFRPLHLEAAVDADKHIFCEKPVAIDPPGVRRVLDAVRKSKTKNLAVVSGFCFRYANPNRAVFGRVGEGAIGDVLSLSSFRYGGDLSLKPRQAGWSDLEFQLRNWFYYNWMSGDLVIEQAVHSLDMMSWVMGDIAPEKAIGSGGRQVRIDQEKGNVFDHFAVELTYPGGVKGYHFARQQTGVANRNSVDVVGTGGKMAVDIGSRYEILGPNPWKYDGPNNNMYQTEHDELFASIRSGTPINDGDWMTNSTMVGILATLAAYSGAEVTWERALNSNVTFGPLPEEFHMGMGAQAIPVAKPGSGLII